jgi:hypothetical protein
MCGLHFEVSGLRHCTPVRPVVFTDQTDLMLLAPVNILGFLDQPWSPMVFC